VHLIEPPKIGRKIVQATKFLLELVLLGFAFATVTGFIVVLDALR